MLACTGDDAVRGARLARLDREGLTIPGQTWDVEVDAVCVGHGIAPSTELAAGLGCELRVGPDGRPAVVRDAAGRTSVPGVWAIGDGSRFAGQVRLMIDGQRCGAALVQELRPDAAAPGVRQPDRANARQARRVERRARRLNRAGRVVAEVYPPWTPDLSEMDPQTVICRDAQRLAQLAAGLSDGIGSAGSLKRVTRAGMGSCQGRYCAGSLTRLAAAVTGIEPDPRSGFRPQLPSSPTRIGTIAAPEDTASTHADPKVLRTAASAAAGPVVSDIAGSLDAAIHPGAQCLVCRLGDDAAVEVDDELVHTSRSQRRQPLSDALVTAD